MPIILATDKLIIGNTYRWKLTAWKIDENGVEALWDLTGATVTLIVREADNNTTTSTATISDAVNGEAYYDSDVNYINQVGPLTAAWQVSQGGTVARSAPIPYSVISSP